MKEKIGIYLLLALQVVCAGVFVSEILISVLGLSVTPIAWQLRELIELGAALGLILGVVLGALYLRLARKRTRAAESALRVASGAFMDLVEERFVDWRLTPAERDVALFALKGLSLSEIAELRGTSEGTVKAQTNAIYRKAGVSGRTQLLSLFMDDLMGDALIPGPDQAA